MIRSIILNRKRYKTGPGTSPESDIMDSRSYDNSGSNIKKDIQAGGKEAFP